MAMKVNATTKFLLILYKNKQQGIKTGLSQIIIIIILKDILFYLIIIIYIFFYCMKSWPVENCF